MQPLAEYSPLWFDVCTDDDLVINSGVCALIENQQIAIFALRTGAEDHVYAISNYDPVGKAQVLYRGIVGSVEEEPVVASPLYKEHYSLLTGKCIEREDVSVQVFAARFHEGRVQVAL